MKKDKVKKSGSLTARDKIGYTFGDFGCNMTFQLVSAPLLLFASEGLGIGDNLFFLIMFIGKLFDAINDPIIGALADRRKVGKHGKYKPWIFWGAFAIAATAILMFVDTSATPLWFRVVYLLITYMLWSIAYTAVNVPYGSLNAALTDDSGERASLSSLRNVGAGFAMLFVSFVPKIVHDSKTGELINSRFLLVAIVCGLIGIIGFMLTTFLTREKSTSLAISRTEKIDYRQTVKTFFKNKAMVALSIASLIQIAFILSYTLTLQRVYEYYFYDNSNAGIFSILVMLPMMAFIPFMSKLSTKFGKKEIATWPNILGAVVTLAMLFVPFPRDTIGKWIFTGMLMLAMAGGGTFMLGTWSMVADCVDAQEIQTGKREEASIYATYSFVRKVSQGIAFGVVALAHGVAGYIKKETVHNQQPAVATGILKGSILILLVGFVLAFVVLLLFYDLNKKKVEENTLFLREKHKDDIVDLEPTRLFYPEEVSEDVNALPAMEVPAVPEEPTQK